MLQRLCCGDENLILVSGCTPKQKVPLLLGPGEHQIFVNGEHLEKVATDLNLRSDRDHTVFIKRAGYKPELIVLRSEGEKGKQTLKPGRIELKLAKRIERGTLGVEIGEVVEPKPAPPTAPPASQPEPPASQMAPPASQPAPPASQMAPPDAPTEP